MTTSASMLDSVAHIIAVASGKGGVGKSTTAANLALALSQQGAKVGILDADIYGPSLGILFGLPEGTKPAVKDEKYFVPIKAHGVEVMTMAFLTSDQTPMAWRGPMASGALLQLLTQTAWGQLDYLIIDMPPGTGDIQLTLAQKVPVTAAVIVTTPQDLALIDAKKAIGLFEKVNIPVLGVIENMAVHICSHCGHIEHLFGEGGGEKLAKQYHVHLLGSLPLSLSIREQADSGKPTVFANPTSDEAKLYQAIALQMVQQVAQLKATASVMPFIETTDE
ncbi:iron-sulfur cluster carrier protein ApbC [Entomomonas asaccharolytica]|uniref:Iron-sulfur cluster carrier protein n=1 Tax=Entomomonas asaccharolytica TaxID=2785331 RepID=A0A974ND03_9GAMM|nr:iron-sulfur cluster carrier protein ApbC [Entomomonas asaccharolytica]